MKRFSMIALAGRLLRKSFIAGVSVLIVASSAKADGEKEGELARNPRENAFLRARLEMIDERAKLVCEGATEKELTAWARRNSQQIAGSLPDAIQMAKMRAAARPPLALDKLESIEASNADDGLIVRQTENRKIRAEILAQLKRSSTKSTLTALETLRLHNAATVESWRAIVRGMAQTTSANMELIPTNEILSDKASPEFLSWIAHRNGIIQRRHEFLNARLGDTSIKRREDEKKWLNDNRGNFDFLKSRPSNLFK